MKTFATLAFDAARCRKELAELQNWLARRPVLNEKNHILPFFRKRRHLSAFIASYSPNVIRLNRIAFEYPLFGDFTCDDGAGSGGRLKTGVPPAGPIGTLTRCQHFLDFPRVFANMPIRFRPGPHPRGRVPE